MNGSNTFSIYLISVCPPALRAIITSSFPYFSSASALCIIKMCVSVFRVLIRYISNIRYCPLS